MTEQQIYEVLEKFPDFEVRHYPDHVVAETEVGGPFEMAGNRAFPRLARFIGGHNRAAELLAAVAEAGLEATGTVRYARFDPPWTPWFLRRNEVVVTVQR